MTFCELLQDVVSLCVVNAELQDKSVQVGLEEKSLPETLNMKNYYFSGLIYETVNCLVGVILK